MAQAFVSTYKNHYRWNCQPRAQMYDPNKCSKLKPEGDIWMLDINQDVEEELHNLAKIEEAIHKLYLKRMRSTYQVSYCDNIKPFAKKWSAVELGETTDRSTSMYKREGDQDDLENELLEYCKNLYGVKKRKIVPPLSTATNVFGYTRPTRLLTPLTVYQNEYGRVGYNVLKAGI